MVSVILGPGFDMLRRLEFTVEEIEANALISVPPPIHDCAREHVFNVWKGVLVTTRLHLGEGREWTFGA